MVLLTRRLWLSMSISMYSFDENIDFDGNINDYILHAYQDILENIDRNFSKKISMK